MRRTKGIAQNDYEIIRKEIVSIFEDNYRSYGYRRITAELNARGYHVNHKLVQRLMKEENIKCERHTKTPPDSGDTPFGTYSEHFGKKCEDLLNREFRAFECDEIWVTDMTRIKTGKLTLYLTIIVDLYNTEVIAYNISDEADLRTVLKTVRFAHYKHPNAKPILHSDRGWFYCADYYIDLLDSYGYTRSMSETGSCYDNAVAESFFAQLKKELIYPREWTDKAELSREIHKYIKYYNTKRIKKTLNYLTPEEYRSRSKDWMKG